VLRARASIRALAVGTRFDTLRRELGDNFIVVEFPGRKHATLTEHRQPQGVDRVLAFFEEKLKPTAGPARAECKGHRCGGAYTRI
jgi:hypothetical protein